MASRIGDFRRKIALGQYEVTSHADEEMEIDDFTLDDLKSAVYGGRIVRMQRHRGHSRKYLIEGKAVDGRPLRLVCRPSDSGRLRIITIFAVRA